MLFKRMSKLGKAATYLAIISVVSFAVALGVFFAPGGVYAQGGSEGRLTIDEEKNLPVLGIELIEIDTDSIDIVVVPTDDENMRVELKGFISGLPKAENPVIFDVETQGETVSVRGEIKSDFGIYREIRLTLTAYIPRTYGKDISIDTSSGDFHVEGFSLKKLDVETSSGDISMDSVAGDVIICDSSSGDLEAENIKTRQFTRIASSGDTGIVDFSGAFDCDVSSGRVEVQFSELNMNVDIEVTSGDISLEMPASSEFEVDIKTTSGNIDSDFPITMILEGRQLDDNKLKGSVGKGGPSVRIEASSGDVKLIQRQ